MWACSSTGMLYQEVQTQMHPIREVPIWSAAHKRCCDYNCQGFLRPGLFLSHFLSCGSASVRQRQTEENGHNCLLHHMFASLSASHTNWRESFDLGKKFKFSYYAELNFSIVDGHQKTMGRKERLDRTNYLLFGPSKVSHFLSCYRSITMLSWERTYCQRERG